MPTALRIWEWPCASEARAARDRSLMETILKIVTRGYKKGKEKKRQSIIHVNSQMNEKDRPDEK